MQCIPSYFILWGSCLRKELKGKLLKSTEQHWKVIESLERFAWQYLEQRITQYIGTNIGFCIYFLITSVNFAWMSAWFFKVKTLFLKVKFHSPSTSQSKIWSLSTSVSSSLSGYFHFKLELRVVRCTCIWHHGRTWQTGHYTADVKVDNIWYSTSDYCQRRCNLRVQI